LGNFPRDSCKLPKEKIAIARISNFALKISPEVRDLQSEIMYFITKFSDNKKIFRQDSI